MNEMMIFIRGENDNKMCDKLKRSGLSIDHLCLLKSLTFYNHLLLIENNNRKITGKDLFSRRKSCNEVLA